MKILRSMGCILCCIAICIGVGILSLQAVLGDVMKEQVVALSTETIMSEVLTSSIGDIVEIPKEQQAQVKQLQKEIVKDENITEISEEIMGAVLSQNQPLGDIESKLEDVIATYAPQAAQAAGIQVTPQEVQAMVDEKLQTIDVQEVLQEKIDEVKTKIPQSTTKNLDTLYQAQSISLDIIGYGCICAGLILILILCFHPWRWLGYVAGSGIVGGGLMMIFGKVIPMFLPSQLDNVTMVKDMVEGASDTIFQYGLWYFVIAMCAFVAYLVFYNLTKPKYRSHAY